MPMKLIIDFDEVTSAVSVNGPIDNKVVAFGMLEAAKDAIIEYHREKKNKIQPVGIMPPSIMKG